MRYREIAVGMALLLALGHRADAKTSEAAIRAVGVSVASLGNPYFTAADAGIHAKSAGITPQAKITIVASEYDLNKQFDEIDNFIAAGDSIIMVNAVDPVAVLPAVKRAQHAGIVVAAFDAAARGADVTVMTNNIKAGGIACQYVVDHLKGGKGNVIILNGPQVSPIADRVTGCHKVLAQHPGVVVLSDNQNALASRDGGFAVGQSLLTKFPAIDAVFAVNDQSAIGFELAAKQAHRTSLFIASVDGAPDIVDEIKSSTSLIKASSAQDPFGMAGHAYELAVDIAKGTQRRGQVILLDPTLLTAQNIGSYKGWNSTH